MFIELSSDDLANLFEEAHQYLVNLDQQKGGWFANPVTDLIAPGYSLIIKQPMDLSTISSKLLDYSSLKEFSFDIELMFKNCMTFNEENSYIHQLAKYMLCKWFRKRKEVLSLILRTIHPSDNMDGDVNVNGQLDGTNVSLSRLFGRLFSLELNTEMLKYSKINSKLY